MGRNEGLAADLTASEIWYENHKTVLVLLLVLAASLTLPYFRVLNDYYPNAPPALVAVLAGAIVAVVVYLPMRYGSPKYALSNAMLVGMLVAEFCVYGAPCTFPAPVAIAFFFFMFYYGFEEADHLWPANKKCSASTLT
jgi:hypothetical protein